MHREHDEPVSPNLDAMMSGPDPTLEEKQSPRRSFRARVSDTIQRARGRSPSPAPAHTDQPPASPAPSASSPSKLRGMGKFIRKSFEIGRSPSPSPSRNRDVVYSYHAPEYQMPDLPDWQLYDGTSVSVNLDQLAERQESLVPPPTAPSSLSQAPMEQPMSAPPLVTSAPPPPPLG